MSQFTFIHLVELINYYIIMGSHIGKTTTTRHKYLPTDDHMAINQSVVACSNYVSCLQIWWTDNFELFIRQLKQ